MDKILNKNRILDLISSTEDLKKLSIDSLDILCREIREQIIETTSKTGGHVASSLGAVELIVAVHSTINSPKDKFIFDVGHQAYAHKILTNRCKEFSTLRSLNGISGFLNPHESEHDFYFSGHASDSLSVAIGIARANKELNKNSHVVVLIGDASIAGGISFEALNYIGQERLPIIIILNENNRSISETVGGLKDHLNALRTSWQYRATTKKIKWELIESGMLGKLAFSRLKNIKDSVRGFLQPEAVLFEQLGIPCTSFINGHNIVSLKSTLNRCLSMNEPVIMQVITQKGAGYAPALNHPEKFHGIGPFSIKNGKSISKPKNTFTSVFEDAILNEAKHDDKIIALSAAMKSGTGLFKLEAKYPNRVIDVGIAEQHLVAMSLGLANSGLKPVVCVYSAFLQRSLDQLITNIALMKSNVVICIDRGGIVGVDGVTHHGLFDIVYTRMIPNMHVLAPSCAYELRCALHTAINSGGPWAIRYPKNTCYEIDDSGNISETLSKNEPAIFEIGRARKLTKGKDIAILAFGECVYDALISYKELKKCNIEVSVYDMRFVKPLDIDAIKQACLETKNIITIESGVIAGGVGQDVIYNINKLGLNLSTNVINLGIEDKFIYHGKTDELKHIAKIDSAYITHTAKKMFNKFL